jgi:hypothetical protein|tara:strand:+ start:2394 stop:2717 length:324 start_codon:yes stop_codon:yes gene_type:complete
MGYKMKSSVAKIIMENGLVEKKALPPGIQGVTYNDGTIAIDKNLSPVQQKIALSHERVHRDQILRGDLSYDDENIYWKGKKYPRKNMKEGSSNLKWEAEAYKKQSKK